jgi:hypothetical protein
MRAKSGATPDFTGVTPVPPSAFRRQIEYRSGCPWSNALHALGAAKTL